MTQVSRVPGILKEYADSVGSHLVCINKAEGVQRFKPLVEQVAHEPFAQLDFDRQVKPALRETFRTRSPPAITPNTPSCERNSRKSLRESAS